jgi:hypothetical protein
MIKTLLETLENMNYWYQRLLSKSVQSAVGKQRVGKHNNTLDWQRYLTGCAS